MPEHAYRCTCGERTRMYFPLSDYPFPEELPCRCGKKLVRFFEGAPGMQPDIWVPYHDHGLGVTVTSRSQRDRIAKEKGLSIVSTEEFNKKTGHASQKEEFGWDREKWRDCAEKAYNDLKYGNVEVPETPAVDTALAAVSNPEG